MKQNTPFTNEQAASDNVTRLSPLMLLGLLVLLIGMLATYFAHQSALNAEHQIQQENFDARTGEIVLRIEQRLATYEQVLRGLKGLYVASRHVDRDEFRSYADNLHLAEHYPGIQGVGYSMILPPQEKAAHIASIRQQGFPDYVLSPVGERELYTSIVYLEPFSGRNLRAFGYDMYSETVRRAAMEKARDTDQPVMSGKVTLVQEAGQKVQAGFLIYLPIYRQGSPHATLAERRANIIGWVYAPFRMNDLMQGILGEQVSSIDYEIFDSEYATPATLMFDNDGHLSLHKDESAYHSTHRIEITGQTWTVKLRSLPAFEANLDSGRINAIWLTGILLSVLLALLVWLLAYGRTRALRLAQDMTSELRTTLAELEEAHDQLLQSEKMASIGQLAAGVAHEINNPIGYVYSNLGSLEKYVQDAFELLDLYEQAESRISDAGTREQIKDAKARLDIVFLKEDLSALMAESKEGITRVREIVQNLKDFSHVDASDEFHFADLHQGLDSTLNIVHNEIKYKANVHKEYGTLPEVECLASQLNQVFMNLLVNAAHAIEERGTITIRTGQQGDEVWVEITDTGKGIAPENLKKIFDPFFTTKPIGKGTGLGLSLSYGILKKHNGRMEVESTIGKGTTFRVWLPVSHAQEQSPLSKGE